MLKSMFAA